MYLADYHVHSRVSPDASASMTELAEAAIRLGFQELCFTDHVEPIRFGTTEPRESYDWAPMLAEFRAAQAAVGDRITLRFGARTVTVEVLSVQETVRQAEAGALYREIP